jgi:hypothetical protein
MLSTRTASSLTCRSFFDLLVHVLLAGKAGHSSDSDDLAVV